MKLEARRPNRGKLFHVGEPDAWSAVCGRGPFDWYAPLGYTGPLMDEGAGEMESVLDFVARVETCTGLRLCAFCRRKLGGVRRDSD